MPCNSPQAYRLTEECLQHFHVQEASFALKSNDPAGGLHLQVSYLSWRRYPTLFTEVCDAGFNAVDVLAWGAIGHAIGYLILATTSLNNSGFNPKPF